FFPSQGKLYLGTNICSTGFDSGRLLGALSVTAHQCFSARRPPQRWLAAGPVASDSQITCSRTATFDPQFQLPQWLTAIGEITNRASNPYLSKLLPRPFQLPSKTLPRPVRSPPPITPPSLEGSEARKRLPRLPSRQSSNLP